MSPSFIDIGLPFWAYRPDVPGISAIASAGWAGGGGRPAAPHYPRHRGTASVERTRQARHLQSGGKVRFGLLVVEHLLPGVAELPGHPVQGAAQVVEVLGPLHDRAAELRAGRGDHRRGGQLRLRVEDLRDDLVEGADRLFECLLRVLRDRNGLRGYRGWPDWSPFREWGLRDTTVAGRGVR